MQPLRRDRIIIGQVVKEIPRSKIIYFQLKICYTFGFLIYFAFVLYYYYIFYLFFEQDVETTTTNTAAADHFAPTKSETFKTN